MLLLPRASLLCIDQLFADIINVNISVQNHFTGYFLSFPSFLSCCSVKAIFLRQRRKILFTIFSCNFYTFSMLNHFKIQISATVFVAIAATFVAAATDLQQSQVHNISLILLFAAFSMTFKSNSSCNSYVFLMSVNFALVHESAFTVKLSD